MNEKEMLLRIISDRPIAYHPDLAKATKSIQAGIFLSQLLYWTGKGRGPDGWIYKTQDEWYAETGLNRRSQETARKRLKKLGIIEEMRKQTPARLFFRINPDNLIKTLKIFYEDQKTDHTKKSELAMISETLEARFTDAANLAFLNQPDEKIISALADYLDNNEKRENLETDIDIFFQFAGQKEIDASFARKLVNISFILDKFDAEQYRQGRKVAGDTGDKKLSYLRKVLEKAFRPKSYKSQRSLQNKKTPPGKRRSDEGPQGASEDV